LSLRSRNLPSAYNLPMIAAVGERKADQGRRIILMDAKNDPHATPSAVAPGQAPPAAKDGQLAAKAEPPPAAPAKPPGAAPPAHPRRKWLMLGGGVVVLALVAYFLDPWVITMLNTVSTDDAYVNGHVTFVAPRVVGQVTTVLVDDNYRVKKGDLLVQLDPEPYQVQVNIKKAAVVAAESDLTAAKAQVRGLEAQARSQRWMMQSAMQNVLSQISNLRANVEVYKSKQATLKLAQDNLKRGEELAPKGISKEELDQRRQTVKVDEAAVEQALQAIYAARAALDLPAQPPPGHDLTYVPQDQEQVYPAVRTALANLVQSLAQLGLQLASSDATPRQYLADIMMRDFRPPTVFGTGTVGALAAPAAPTPFVGASILLAAKGDINRILEELVLTAPAVLQADAKLKQANRDLDQALLNLRYCNIVSEIDGVVTRRNVNPGNNVQVGQSLMAVRSITEIWIDCNFKETQLGNLRIGQRVKVEVDMYGSHREFEGRITGFTMGTGETLSLLPPQNATGNFVKIVQRLPVRVELTDYQPDRAPLFVGLSCTPYVYYKEPPTGPRAGDVLQPFAPLPHDPMYPKP
jgi:membrane fusion protein, multidrug efflux system